MASPPFTPHLPNETVNTAAARIEGCATVGQAPVQTLCNGCVGRRADNVTGNQAFAVSIICT